MRFGKIPSRALTTSPYHAVTSARFATLSGAAKVATRGDVAWTAWGITGKRVGIGRHLLFRDSRARCDASSKWQQPIRATDFKIERVILLNTSNRRRGAIVAVLGLTLSLASVGVTNSVVQAAPGTLATPNACKSSANGNWSNIDWTLSGTAAPNPITLGAGNITLSGGAISANIPAGILVAGYNLGLLTLGVNSIPNTLRVARSATNVDIGGGVSGTKTQVDVLSLSLSTTIGDPDGTPATGDETATPMAVNEPLPNMVVTPLGGNVVFSQGGPGTLPVIPAGVAAPGAVTPLGGIFVTSVVAGGLIKHNFDCQAGTPDPIVPPATGSKSGARQQGSLIESASGSFPMKKRPTHGVPRESCREPPCRAPVQPRPCRQTPRYETGRGSTQRVLR